MDPIQRIEDALSGVVARAEHPAGPPRLAAALRYAVFPGGARVRPRLALAVACACGDDRPAVTDAAASAIELLHCASLVHDDLPCFDDAATRRGKASVHRAFDERLAVLAGDALIVMAYDALTQVADEANGRLADLLRTLNAAVTPPHGIAAGQAWECEPRVALADYQRAKTGALFSAATVAGAAAAGHEAERWRTLGEKLGEAYQVADDIRDVASSPQDIGKPIGRDVALGRPSAARELGLSGALGRLQQLITAAVESIPDCAGAASLEKLIEMEVQRLVPKELARRVA